MFERRLKLLLIVLALPTLGVALRLVQLQVFHAAGYQEDARKMLEMRPRLLPCVRGAILDYEGRPLARAAASWDVAVHYAVMVDEPAIRKRVFAKLGVRDTPDLAARIDESWERIAALTRMPRELLDEEARLIVSRVQRRKQRNERLSGVRIVLLEEVTPHTVIRGLNQSEQVEARIALATYPWVEVVPGHTRSYQGGVAIAHVLGQMLRVTDVALRNDPRAEDELGCYQGEDYFGVSGAEAMGEQWLRGTRGRVHEDREGEILSHVEPRNGQDVRLTIDVALQQELYRRLAAEIERKYPNSTGGCAVVLDLPSRQVLAMVDYPSIDPHDPTGTPSGKAANKLCEPWTFRAVARPYPPGSTVKPMLLAGALEDGTVTPGTRIDCNHYLFPEYPDRWRCEGYHPGADPVLAIQKSCNVFFYVLGEKMTVPREAYWMSQFGLGQKTGTKLIEEAKGSLPTRRTNGEARYAAIGQSQTEITPIQAANMVACIATGSYQPVQFWANDPEPRPAPVNVGIDEKWWKLVREGMFQAVNKEHGTAYQRAELHEPGDYVLLGKTGSADAHAPEWIYTCRLADGQIQHIRARNWATLCASYPADARPEYIDQQKPAEYEVTHGWFVGYLTRKDRYLQPVRGEDLSVAIAVVIEFAGHGGEVAAPVAGDMISTILYRQRGGVGTPPDAGTAKEGRP